MLFFGFETLHESHFVHNTVTFSRISRSQTVIKAKTNLATDKVLNSYCGLHQLHKQFQNMLIRFLQFFPRTAYQTLQKLQALDLKDTLNLLKNWQSTMDRYLAIVWQLSVKMIQMTHKKTRPFSQSRLSKNPLSSPQVDGELILQSQAPQASTSVEAPVGRTYLLL